MNTLGVKRLIKQSQRKSLQIHLHLLRLLAFGSLTAFLFVLILHDRVFPLHALIPSEGAFPGPLLHLCLLPRLEIRLLVLLAQALLALREDLELVLVALLHVRQGLVELLDALAQLELDERVPGALVQALLDEHAPPVVARVVRVLRVVLLDQQPRNVGAAADAVLERDLAEQVHLKDVGKLRRRDLVPRADIMEELGGDDGRCGEETRPALALVFIVRVGVDVDVVLEELRAEHVVVCAVAEGVKGFVRVFDGQLEDGGIFETRGVDDRVEVGSVAGALVRREDEELGYPDAGRQLVDLDLVKVWPWIVPDGWFLRTVSLIEPPAVGGCVSDYRILRSDGCGRGNLLISAVTEMSNCTVKRNREAITYTK